MMASCLLVPHVSRMAGNEEQTLGLFGCPKIEHLSSTRLTHGIPAGLPCGMPGIAELIDISTQHAPHWWHSISLLRRVNSKTLQVFTDLSGSLLCQRPDVNSLVLGANDEVVVGVEANEAAMT